MKKLIPLYIANGLAMSSVFAFVPLAGPIARTLSLQEWHAGLIVAFSSFIWMLSAPLWGRLSDRKGRRVVMGAGAISFAISYILLAGWLQFSITTQPHTYIVIIGFLIFRTISGISFAAIPVGSMAYIADVTTPENRTSAMASLGVSAGIGIIGGPAITGILVNYGLLTPIFVVSILPIFTAILIFFVLPPSPEHKRIDNPYISMTDRRIFITTVKMFLVSFSVTSTNILVGFRAIDALNLSPEQGATVAGYALMTVGMTMIFVQAGMMKLKKISNTQWQTIGGLIGAIGFTVIVFADSSPLFVLSYAISAAGCCLIFPALHSEITLSVEQSEVGAAAGRLSAAEALSGITAPLVATSLYGFFQDAPYLLGVAFLITVSLFAFFTKSDKTLEGEVLAVQEH